MQEEKEKVFTQVSRILTIGSYSAALILIFGLGMLFLQGHPKDYLSKPPPLCLSTFISHLAKGEPISLINLGILVMMFTPFLRVAVAGFSFLAEKDYKYASVACGVMLILLFTLALSFL